MAPEQIDDLRGLLAGSDSVELKLTVPDADQRSAVRALGMDPLSAEVRQVYFFDTPDLTLNKQGVILRARRTRKLDDTVVKRRPVRPDDLPSELRSLDAFTIEVDAVPGGYVCSGTLKRTLRAGKVSRVMLGQRAPRSLFDKQQRAYLAMSTSGDVVIDELPVLGPITLLKLKFRPDGFPTRMVAELWLYPDGSRILELSTKAAPEEAFTAAAEFRRFLDERGVVLTGEQQMKTATALTFFAAELRR